MATYYVLPVTPANKRALRRRNISKEVALEFQDVIPCHILAGDGREVIVTDTSCRTRVLIYLASVTKSKGQWHFWGRIYRSDKDRNESEFPESEVGLVVSGIYSPASGGLITGEFVFQHPGISAIYQS